MKWSIKDFHISKYQNMPWQVVPSPVNPCLQAQLKEPSLLVQFAFLLHGLVSAKHSSISKEIKGNHYSCSIVSW